MIKPEITQFLFDFALCLVPSLVIHALPGAAIGTIIEYYPNLLDNSFIFGILVMICLFIGSRLNVRLQKMLERFTYSYAARMQRLERCDKLIEKLNKAKERTISQLDTVLRLSDEGAINEGKCVDLCNRLKTSYMEFEHDLAEIYSIRESLISM